tara:strand:- start:216 stop:458 length:243 start_codon:yes stop_codon:yes gene_type:complete
MKTPILIGTKTERLVKKSGSILADFTATANKLVKNNDEIAIEEEVKLAAIKKLEEEKETLTKTRKLNEKVASKILSFLND